MVISGPAARTRASAKQSTSTSRRESIQNNSRTTTATLVKRSSLQAPITPNNVDKFKAFEERLNKLEKDNSALKGLVNQLEEKVTAQDAVIRNLLKIEEASKENITVEQLELNSNIIVRGVEVDEESSSDKLEAVFTGLREHLGVSSEAEFDPVSVTTVSSKSRVSKNASRPIRVVFKSIAAKRNFLQIRRVKKDIFPREIKVEQKSQRPLLITEDLTYENQQLLYQARSLRGTNKYNFVWSNNGQVLARRDRKSRVVRILSAEHVNQLRHHIGLSPLDTNGPSRSPSIVGDGSRNQN